MYGWSIVHFHHFNCIWTVHLFYAVSLYLSCTMLGRLSHKDSDRLFLLWPLSWLEGTGLKTYFYVIPIILFIVNLVTLCFYRKAIFRFLFSVLCLFTAALDNSEGSINHSWHNWFWLAFMLIFLPNRSDLNSRGHKLATTSLLVYI